MAAAKRDPEVAFFKGGDSQWYWHLKGGNREVQAQGEGHKTKRDAQRAFRAACRSFLRVIANAMVVK